MSGREEILSSLRRSLGRDKPVDAETAATLRARIDGHASSTRTLTVSGPV